MTEPCRAQWTSPGELFPPTCCELRGHEGQHKSRAEFIGGKLTRVTWANEEESAA